mgnify:CR=1 FL=1
MAKLGHNADGRASFRIHCVTRHLLLAFLLASTQSYGRNALLLPSARRMRAHWESARLRDGTVRVATRNGRPTLARLNIEGWTHRRRSEGERCICEGG